MFNKIKEFFTGKPAEVKALIGSRSQSPAVPVFVNTIPEPPRRLEESGLRFWNEVWLLSWLNPASDIEAVALVAERLDERDLLRGYVLDNVVVGLSPHLGKFCLRAMHQG